MIFDIVSFLKHARLVGASDLHLKTNSPPSLKIEGKLVVMNAVPPISEKDMEEAVSKLTTERQRRQLDRNLGLDIAFDIPDSGRYRINIFYQRGSLALAARVIPSEIKSIRELNLPKVIERLAIQPRGLILVTGIAGSGKSTTLAAMIEHINTHKNLRVITIEDPIEYVFKDKKSVIFQREVGIDTLSFATGLKEALRQDPNIIMVGEMRDTVTMEIALQAAETGHLVLSTLHTMDAKETINRIISVFPPYQQNEVRVQLASVLHSVISQRLVPRMDGTGRVPAVEVMVVTSRIRDIILNPARIEEIRQAISEGFTPYGMQSFEQSLFYLWKRRLITEEAALSFATNRENLALRMKGITTDQESRYWQIFEDMAIKELEKDKEVKKETKMEAEIENLMKEWGLK